MGARGLAGIVPDREQKPELGVDGAGSEPSLQALGDAWGAEAMANGQLMAPIRCFEEQHAAFILQDGADFHVGWRRRQRFLAEAEIDIGTAAIAERLRSVVAEI